MNLLMNKLMPRVDLDEKEQEFTGEEVAIFKRYIEENIVHTDNNFEFLEENLTYYSYRYTSEHYFSPAELLHVNSNMLKTEEMVKNIDLYYKAIKWHSSTVHPQDSEYVLKKEKYTDIKDFPPIIVDLIHFLNELDMNDFFILDLYIYINGEIYTYLPKKNFLFKWKGKADIKIERLINEQYFSFFHSHELLTETDPIVLLPVFIPIRKMLFLGEYGYKSGLIQYGKVIGHISNFFLNNEKQFKQIEYFDSKKMSELFRLDGIERSVQTVFITK